MIEPAFNPDGAASPIGGDQAMTGAAVSLPPSMRRLVLALLLAATFVVYVGTLGFDFVNDDHDQIVRNFHVHAWRYAPRYFTSSFWNSVNPNAIDNYYRPVCLLAERMAYQLCGEDPRGWHAAAILLHVLVTLLVYLLASKLLADGFVAGLSALLFGVHPVHIEAVAWISGASESLGTAFLLAAFLAYLRFRSGPTHRRLWFGASLGLFIAGLLAKETVVVLPLLLLAYEWMFPNPENPGGATWRWRCLVSWLAPAIAVLLAYLAARRLVLGVLSHTLNSLPASRLLLSLPLVGWFYLRHLLWPVNLSPYYDLAPIVSPTMGNFVWPLAALLFAGLVLAAWCRRSRTARFAVVWMVVGIMPVLDIAVFKPGHTVHDRYLYLPSVGFAMLVALAVRHATLGRARVFGAPAIQLGLTGAIALAYAVGAVGQSVWWANDLLHAQRSVAIAPGNLDAWHNLATEVAARGNQERAIRIYEQVLSKNPDYWPSTYNLGILYYRLGRMPDAVWYLIRAANIDPGDPRSFTALAAVSLQKGDPYKAADFLRHALELSPDGVGYHLALGRIFKSQGNIPEALKEFREELARHPESTAAREEIANLPSTLPRGSGVPAP